MISFITGPPVLLAMGLQSIPVGSAVYLLIKLGGYSFAATKLNKAYQKHQPILKIGAIRTGLGLVFGSAYYAIMYAIQVKGGPVSPIFLLGLIPIRYLEWWIITHFFYRKDRKFRRRDFVINLSLIVLSFCLDVPTIFGIILIGGFWVC
ncbi:MAG TPA: hypothetical protein VNZ86_20075 [Bacteroidia bacterium]|jgi:hypothetical protein|nr:hypothetical protein [Bacteroidia bacterium]